MSGSFEYKSSLMDNFSDICNSPHIKLSSHWEIEKIIAPQILPSPIASPALSQAEGSLLCVLEERGSLERWLEAWLSQKRAGMNGTPRIRSDIGFRFCPKSQVSHTGTLYHY